MTILEKCQRAYTYKQWDTLNILMMGVLSTEKDIHPYLHFLPYLSHYHENQHGELLTKEQFLYAGDKLLEEHPDYYWRSPYGCEHFFHIDLAQKTDEFIQKCLTLNSILFWEKHEDFEWGGRIGHIVFDKIIHDELCDDLELDDATDVIAFRAKEFFNYLEQHAIKPNNYLLDMIEHAAIHKGFKDKEQYDAWYMWAFDSWQLPSDIEDLTFLFDHASVSFLTLLFQHKQITPEVMQIQERFFEHTLLQHILSRVTFEPDMIVILQYYIDFYNNNILKSFFFHQEWPSKWTENELKEVHSVFSVLTEHPNYLIQLNGYNQDPIRDDLDMVSWIQKCKNFEKEVHVEELPLMFDR